MAENSAVNCATPLLCRPQCGWIYAATSLIFASKPLKHTYNHTRARAKHGTVHQLAAPTDLQDLWTVEPLGFAGVRVRLSEGVRHLTHALCSTNRRAYNAEGGHCATSGGCGHVQGGGAGVHRHGRFVVGLLCMWEGRGAEVARVKCPWARDSICPGQWVNCRTKWVVHSPAPNVIWHFHGCRPFKAHTGTSSTYAGSNGWILYPLVLH